MMKFLFKAAAKVGRRWMIRAASLATVIMSLASMFADQPEGCLAWLLGLLTGTIVTLLWTFEEDLADEEEAKDYEQDE